jgi:hypothetical protein
LLLGGLRRHDLQLRQARTGLALDELGDQPVLRQGLRQGRLASLLRGAVPGEEGREHPLDAQTDAQLQAEPYAKTITTTIGFRNPAIAKAG